MGNYSRDNNRRGGGFDRGRDRGRPTMHRATCSECGDSCEIPFKPTGSKPVFCSNCFGRQQDSGGRGGSRFGGDRRDNRRDNSRGDRQMHDATCVKCGDNCQVPFRPTAGKDIFCSECFEKGGNTGGKKGGNSDEELKEINTKLDMIMDALGLSGDKKEKKTKKPATKKVAKKKTVKKVAKKEVKKTAKKKATTKKTVTKKKPAVKKTVKKATKAKPKAKAKKTVKKKAVAKKKK